LLRNIDRPESHQSWRTTKLILWLNSHGNSLWRESLTSTQWLKLSFIWLSRLNRESSSTSASHVSFSLSKRKICNTVSSVDIQLARIASRKLGLSNDKRKTNLHQTLKSVVKSALSAIANSFSMAYSIAHRRHSQHNSSLSHLSPLSMKKCLMSTKPRRTNVSST
jgi:hypothetical protein